jgi:hypothetical protein
MYFSVRRISTEIQGGRKVCCTANILEAKRLYLQLMCIKANRVCRSAYSTLGIHFKVGYTVPFLSETKRLISYLSMWHELHLWHINF